MKRLLYITALIASCCLSSCHEEQEDYHTTAIVTVTAPDTITVERLQGTLTLQNLNTTYSQSTSDMYDKSFQMTVLRGAYKVDVEGMVRYIGTDGQRRTVHYRAHSDYTPFAEMPQSKAELPITLLQE